MQTGKEAGIDPANIFLVFDALLCLLCVLLT